MITAKPLRDVLKMGWSVVEKKQRLARVDQLQDKGDWVGVIAACDVIIAPRIVTWWMLCALRATHC